MPSATPSDWPHDRLHEATPQIYLSVQGHSWRTAKVRRPRAAVEPHLETLLAALAADNPDLLGVHVVGSWRRGLSEVGDLDLVAVTATGVMTADLLSPGVVLPECVDWSRAGARQAHG